GLSSVRRLWHRRSCGAADAAVLVAEIPHAEDKGRRESRRSRRLKATPPGRPDSAAAPGRPASQRPAGPRAPAAGSAHLTGDVGLGAGVLGVFEDLLGPAVLDEHARAGVALLVAEHGEEGGPVADPRGLLHVVRDDDDRVPRLDVPHQVLDGTG